MHSGFVILNRIRSLAHIQLMQVIRYFLERIDSCTQIISLVKHPPLASPTPHTCHMLPKHTSHRHPAHPAQTQAAPGVITDQALLIKLHKLLIFLLLSKKGVTFKYNK